jgi:hypothetical protein
MNMRNEHKVFSGKSKRMKSFVRPKRSFEDNIKRIIKKKTVMVSTGFNWLKTESSDDGLLLSTIMNLLSQ